MRYSERLTVPLSWWLISLLGLATLWLVIAVPAGNIVGLTVTAVAAAALGGLLLRYGGAAVAVDADTLRAGRARIERRYVGIAEPLVGEAARQARGAGCDARAYLLIRPYLADVVRIEITDPDDPAPYWLVATRRPQRLADALTPGP